ncbi:hypothetical protein BG003_006749 [Podila horticola]|nr:hypothetical protein BG003_006749 [Podila horticola]
MVFVPVAFPFISFEFVHTQSPYNPDSSSVFIEGKAFHKTSGFSVNLRASWNKSNPTYTKLSDGLWDKLFPNTLLPNGTARFAIYNNTIVTYDIPDGKGTQRGSATKYCETSQCWVRIKGAGAVRVRAAHACAVPGDVLTVWGEFSNFVVKKAPVNVITAYKLTAYTSRPSYWRITPYLHLETKSTGR